ncbi:translation initiation factor eIF-2 beta subunit [Coemansia sp. S16]|nr:translation initiation factor eIF-2 beta subunit [Coemansia sp. S17]KAJ2018238.1 translation initiation factor eIF-2 beta subunit [Coemansia sp. S680]KAJ2027431.1 translation initiation factor eIF-2 beta subunit [Coemansia sp. S3946]KAJ2048645.1 translation initiation factor eIF-2 beta subunit [Coemansia sp. S16]KAJ2049129.1 translation initiation factor eIF-2 beta subunit [Coemansia sp. S2]KAJ2065548.1 translation initiation factor eIF-2 beta subunit [Coemansia sp. S155-1]KAJ2084522.1 tra
MSDTELAQKLENTRLEDQTAGNEEDAFDLSAMKKKKKKSKKINFDDETAAADEEAEPTAAAGEDEDEDAFAELKKKKKSKSKIVSFDDAEEAGENAKEDAELFDISSMKKKKKSKKSLAAFEAELGDEEAGAESAPTDRAGEPWIGTDRDYTYGELLDRFFKLHRDKHQDAGGDGNKYKLSAPIMLRDGTKRSVFANVEDIAKRMHRPSEHVIKFLYAELGVSGNIDSNKRLILKGRYQQRQIETVLRHYIVEYVTCKSCKSGETSLIKENSLNFVKCEDCGSTRSVSAIKTGFKAATKDDRRAKRAAA